ncbi:MAG: ATPase [Chloroflexi bacterium]|nr:ATPase [Chloroflexota bacterium]MDL1911395.1 cation-translocating P-type ATPase [Chloroflexi bacterium CFX6]
MEQNNYWHTKSTEQAFAQLDGGQAGISQKEAEARLAKYGPNEIQSAHRISPWEILIDQFKNVLILILLGATAISLFLGHGVESIVIAVIVLFAVLLGFIQEYRAERAIEALRQMAAPTATVLRDGQEVKVPAREVVPGDVVVLHMGDRIPADGRLIESINLQVEEAALTGESVPVEKHTDPLPTEDLPVGDRKNMVYAGTAVTYGRGRALIVATGMQTEFGKIAQLLQTVETTKTPLQQNLDKVGTVLARAAFVVVAIIVALGLLRGQPFIEMLIFGIALAVAVVPEALPAVVTISLAIGVQKMVKRHALIRRLPAVETLGSTSVICSDKTGTLTKDEMTVRKIYAAGQVYDVSGSGYAPIGHFSVNGGTKTEPNDDLKRLLTAAALASDAKLLKNGANGSESDWDIKGDPTEGALIVAAAKAGLKKEALDETYPRVQEIPFTSESKRMTTLHRTDQGTVAYTKGAPEIILENCDSILTASGVKKLDDTARKQVLDVAQTFAGSALRVLAIASKPDAVIESAQTGMTFLGLAGMIDPPRPEAKEAIAVCESAGIRPVMITGDHPVTAQAVARELGLLKNGRVVTGAELDDISDEQFKREVESIDVYARVSPAHKLRVVTALQANEHIVAMTGDGVNDAPALKKADIGIAMGITGTDVTKEAAAMTLTDDNFASIVAAVEEGRGVFGNIKKYLMYLLSSNIGEIGLMAGSALLGLPLPLTAVQILYVNLATDGLPALALSVDPPEKDLMKRKPRNPRTGIFTRPVVALMVAGGLWSTIINLGLFIWAANSGRSIEEAMTMTFVSLVLVQFFKAYNFRSDRHSVFNRPFENKWLNIAIVWEAVLLLLIVYIPALHEPFNTFSLPLVDWAIVFALSLTISPVLEFVKWMVRKGWLGTMDS